MATIKKTEEKAGINDPLAGLPTSSLVSGHMYIYRYKATTKNIRYDEYPLIFMIRKRNAYFDGINFNYLSIRKRIQLLGFLRGYATTVSLTENTSLLVTAMKHTLMTSPRQSYALKTFHRYRIKNIRSSILKISPLNWEAAIIKSRGSFLSS